MPLETVLDDARSIQDWILDLRRRIHRQPELQYEEVETSRLVQKTLGDLSIPFYADIAETGVVGTIGGGDGPCVALRADMDALPIHEETDVEFRSEVDGKMHACGHDCHTAMLLGAARLLKEHEAELPGTVKLLFQPAEEGGGGGKRMRDEGALENPQVQRIFGLHVWPMAETGSVASRAGTFLAASGAMQIVVSGRGGHAAMPHLSIDPVTTSAKIITELQTIISRELDPLDSGVISVTAVHGGEAYNVIPMEVTLRGTIRALSLAQLAIFQNRVREIATLIAKANQCEANVEFPGNAYPPTVNDAHCWDLAGGIAGDLLGADNVLESPPIMGGEDFAYYTEAVPGCFVGLGVRNEAIGADYGVHHPLFKVDEEALPIGSALHAAFALKSLSELSS
jgi:IAA-amino acid hydrolase